MRPCFLVNALLIAIIAASPVPDISDSAGDAAGKVESAYDQAQNGADNSIDSATHFFTGDDLPITGHAAPGHQSCTATDNVFFISYSINIGSEYQPGRCEVLKQAMKQAEGVSNWQCVDDDSDGTARNGKGMFRVWFNAGRNRGQGLNGVLKEVFHEINGFNCPGW